MSGEFDKEVPDTKPQALFFNRENKNAPYKYVSPWDHTYVKNLMQREPRPDFNMNENPLVDKYRDTIEGVTREYEEKFMVEASGDQRPCVMEEACEGRCIPQSPHKFVLREFLLPSQQRGIQFKELLVFCVKGCRSLTWLSLRARRTLACETIVWFRIITTL